LSPARLAECLAALGWSSRYLAIVLSRDPRQIRRWLKGTPIPWQIAEWLESRVRAAERTPPPRKDAAA
jgi:hypothetical protein